MDCWRVGLPVAALPATAAAGTRPHGRRGANIIALSGTVISDANNCLDSFAWVDAAAGKFTCDGGDQFRGSLNGSTTYTIHGTFDDPADPLGSRFTAYETEVFTGRMGRRHGTLTFAEHFSQEAAPPGGSGLDAVTGHVIASSGQLSGMTGSAIWVAIRRRLLGQGHDSASYDRRGTDTETRSGRGVRV